MINLNAYDSIVDKIDKTKTWIDIDKRQLLSREIKFHKYYILTKRFNTKLNIYEYFIILLDEKPNDRISYQTKVDDYGRIKIRLYELYKESDLNTFTKNVNININLIDHQDDGDVYQLDI